MADTGRPAAGHGETETAGDGAALSEIALGRAVAIAIPTVAVLMAVVVGFSVGLGPAILVLAAGAILATIAFLWASVRTLSGDAPIAEKLLDARVAPESSVGGPSERKRTALRALKDLEFERSVGKLDQEDYDDLVERYRNEAKAVMREMDVQIEPFLARAEDLARQHLEKVGLGSGNERSEPEGAARPESREDEPSRSEVVRLSCAECSTSNEPDATFCKKCGAALRRQCGTCETRNELDAQFCKKCGAKLGAGAKEVIDASA